MVDNFRLLDQAGASHELYYLSDALDATLAGKPVAIAQAEALGCLVNLPERERRDSHAKISYADPRYGNFVGDRSMPKYDFNWQPLYVLNPPKLMPAGTRVVMDMTWDNSSQNPANPDPNKVVRWGDQTWEEMNVGWFRFRNADDDDRARAARIGADTRAADMRQDRRAN